MGSISTPSARRIGPVVPAGRTKRRRGPTTVGPVTTSTAPSTIAAWLEMSKIARAPYQPMRNVTTAPTEINRRTTMPVLRSSRGGRSRPPSNRMRATASETNGNSVPPSSSSGSTIPVTGPNSRPAVNSAMIDGTWMRQATHCASIPAPRISARVGPIADSVAANTAAVTFPSSSARQEGVVGHPVRW